MMELAERQLCAVFVVGSLVAKYNATSSSRKSFSSDQHANDLSVISLVSVYLSVCMSPLI